MQFYAAGLRGGVASPGTEAFGAPQTAQLSTEEFHAEGVCDHGLSDDGDPVVPIQWTGFPDPSDHTWECAERLNNFFPELLDDYYMACPTGTPLPRTVIAHHPQWRDVVTHWW